MVQKDNRIRLIDLPITLREAAVKRQTARYKKRNVYAPLANCVRPKTYMDAFFWSQASKGNFSETLKYRL